MNHTHYNCIREVAQVGKPKQTENKKAAPGFARKKPDAAESLPRCSSIKIN